MKQLLLLILLTMPALSQTIVTQPALSSPPVPSFNNVQLIDNQHAAPNPQTNGPVIVTSIVANGSTVVYTVDKAISGAVAGDTIVVSTSGILTTTNTMPAGLLGTCTVTNYHGTVPVTFTCASSTTASWSVTAPAVDQNASTVCNAGNLWQIYTEASVAIGGPGSPPANPGILQLRKSSSSCGATPTTWNAPTNLFTPASNCSGTPAALPDIRIPMLGLAPNGDLTVMFIEECYTPTFSGTVWTMYWDHTTTLWSTPVQFTNHPVGQSTWNWGCFQDSGHFQLAIDGTSMFVAVGGNSTANPICTTSIMYWVFSRDNGHTWGVTASTDIQQVLNGTGPPTFEVDWVNNTGTTWIGFLRAVGSNSAGVYNPFELLISTDNGNTWTITTNSGITNSSYCTTIGSTFNGGGYQISPYFEYGYPYPGLATLWYTDRIGCGATSYGVQMALVMNPASVISSGATYLATLTPQIVSGGIIASSLNGYPYLTHSNSWSFNLWYQAINSSAGSGANNLNIFQLQGEFPPSVTAGGQVTMGGSTTHE